VFKEAFCKRKEIAEIDDSYIELNIDQVKDQIKIAQQQWEELILKGQEIREQELLDYHKVDIGNNTMKEKALQKRIIESIRKIQQRNYQFQYLSQNIRKGQHQSLK